MGRVIFELAVAELGYTQRNMKILLAIALFGAVQAAPEAEADAAAWYGGYYGYGLGYYGGYRGYYGLPAYYGHAAAVQAGAPYANGWTDGPNNGLGPHLLGKREAEAEPEAEAAAYYGGYYGYGGLGYYGGYGYGLGVTMVSLTIMAMPLPSKPVLPTQTDGLTDPTTDSDLTENRFFCQINKQYIP